MRDGALIHRGYDAYMSVFLQRGLYMEFDRRDFLRIAGIGGVVFVSGLAGCTATGSTGADFYFIQLTDIHWGFNNPQINPQGEDTLPRVIAAVNSLEVQPDFVVFTGDLTQTTDDRNVRRARLASFREHAGKLKVRDVRYMPGEHDAALDRGEAYAELFGSQFHSSFDHKGVHFIMLDNVTDPRVFLGDTQLGWLRDDLARIDKDQRVIVLVHRPLFDLAPDWDWTTKDGAKAIELLMPYRNVTVFYGHIHHEHHHRTGHIEHHAAMSTMFPLAPLGTVEKKTQVRWDAASPFKGLGYRRVTGRAAAAPSMVELPLLKS